jgi:beta-N-acetylhexosaminidase
VARRALPAVLVVVALCLGGASGVTAGTTEASAPAPLAELVGARLVVGIDGTTASRSILRRIRQGQVAGVILMGANVRSAAQLRALTTSLHAAARAGGRRILITTDQEGGIVRRLSWAPPSASAAQLGTLGADAIAQQGRATARALATAGVNVDLAPVADVPGVAGSFIAAQRRAYSTSPGRAATAVTAFATGLLDGGVAATLKHFPGLGLATTSTDDAAVTIRATRPVLARGFQPYRKAIAAGVVPLVMISNASYTAYGGRPAAWSPSVLALLRGLGHSGATITDAVEPLATTHGVGLGEAAVRAARAGVDLLLFVGSERSTASVYRSVLSAAQSGRLTRASLEASAARVEALTETYR